MLGGCQDTILPLNRNTPSNSPSSATRSNRQLAPKTTTATVMETQMGNFDTAIALGLILLTLSFSVNLALTLIQQGKVQPR